MLSAAVVDKSRLLSTNSHYQYYPFEYFLKVQAAFGMKNIELYGLPQHVRIGWKTGGDIEKLLQRIEGYGLSVPVLRPECNSSRYMLCAADRERLRRSELYYARCVDSAAGIGAKILSVNALGAYMDEPYNIAFERAAISIYRLCKRAEESGVTIALETFCPGDSMICNSLDELKKLMDAVNHASLTATLDTLSMSEAGETIPKWFETLQGKIGYVCFSDGRSGSERYTWGSGIYPAGHYLDALNRCGYHGFLGMRLTRAEYYQEPELADSKNLDALKRFFMPEEGGTDDAFD